VLQKLLRTYGGVERFFTCEMKSCPLALKILLLAAISISSAAQKINRLMSR